VRRRSGALSLVLVCALGSCAHSDAPPTAKLAIVTGDPAGEATAGCDLAEWTAPWGKIYRACLDPSTAVDVTRRDLYWLRIQDRQYGEQTWYLVSAHLAGGLTKRVWDPLRAQPERPYAVFIDGDLSAVLPGMEIVDYPSLLAATQDLSRAEAIAHAWEVPVVRMISEEIAAQPTYSVSLVQLIASPHRWMGKKVSVHGYLSSPSSTLYLSREHAEASDFESAVQVLPPSDEQGRAAVRACEGRWVVVDGFVDDHGGLPEITRLERLSASDGPDCWPVEPPSRP